MRKRKERPVDIKLLAPTMLRRTWKTWAYNLFFLVLFTTLFFAHYTLDDLAFELDVLFMYGPVRPISLLAVSITFFYFVRACLKTCNVIRYTS